MGKGSRMEKPVEEALRQQVDEFAFAIDHLSKDVTPLIAAAAAGRERLVEQLISFGADLDASCSKYGTALQTSARGRYTAIVGMLVEAGAKVGEKEFTAALDSASLEIVAILIEGYLAHVGGPEYANKSLVSKAVKVGHPEIFALIMERFQSDTKLLQTEYGGEHCAAAVAIEEERPSILRAMLDQGLDPHAVIKTGRLEPMPLLHAACVEANREMVEELIERGADVNFVHGANAPIHFAVDGSRDTTDAKRAERYSIVNLLIDKGADLAVKNSHGRTVLQLVPSKDERMKSIVRSGRMRDMVSSAMGADPGPGNGHSMKIVPL